MNESPFPPSSAAEELLRRWIGLDPHSIGEAAIHRAVRLRMVAMSIDDVSAYVRLLENESAERDRLVEEVVVAEFFLHEFNGGLHGLAEVAHF